MLTSLTYKLILKDRRGGPIRKSQDFQMAEGAYVRKGLLRTLS